MEKFPAPSSHAKHVADNEDFVRLMEVAREDASVCRTLRALLSLDPFNRPSALNTWIEQLRLNHAPAPLIRAVVCLTDPVVADRALELLESRRKP